MYPGWQLEDLIITRIQDNGQALRGNPTRPHQGVTDTTRAEEHDWDLKDPIGARDWDAAANRRQVAWDESPFAVGFTELFRYKSQVVV